MGAGGGHHLPSAKIVAMSHRLLDSLCSYPAIHAAVSQILASIAGKGISHPMQTDGAPIAVHPGSGSPAKCWPLDSYLRLIELLQAAGHPCRIILGEVEHERWPAEQICRLQSAAQTVHPATYVDLFQELSRCCAFIGNDSGPGQLAGILGLPSVILFGPTDPAIWKPLARASPRCASPRCASTTVGHIPRADRANDFARIAPNALLGSGRLEFHDVSRIQFSAAHPGEFS